MQGHVATEDSLPNQEEKVVYTASSSDPASWSGLVLEHGGSRRRRHQLYSNEGTCLMAPPEEVDESCAQLMAYEDCRNCFECHAMSCIRSLSNCDRLLHETVTECCVRNCASIPLSTWLLIIGGGFFAIFSLVLLGCLRRFRWMHLPESGDFEKLAERRQNLQGDVSDTPLSGAQLHLSGGGSEYRWTILSNGSFHSSAPLQEGKVNMESPEKGLLRWVEQPRRHRTREVLGELTVQSQQVCCSCSYVEVEPSRCCWRNFRHLRGGHFVLRGLLVPNLEIVPGNLLVPAMIGHKDESSESLKDAKSSKSAL